MNRPVEDALLEWLRRRTAAQGGDLLGDDAAFLREPGPLAITVDQQLEGVHLPPGLPPELWARRLLAVNLSDLAACGAQPVLAWLTVAAPAEFDLRRFFRTLLAELRRTGTRLAGGDLARHPTVALTLTLAGRRPPGGRWVRRSNARPGDALWLGGPVGRSALGRLLLAAGAGAKRPATLPASLDLPPAEARAARAAIRSHLEPRPQLALGLWLGKRRRAAAIDVSDGLALDLHRLCRESAVGARLHASRLPRQRADDALALRLGRPFRELALGGGEDYVLLFALPHGIVPPRRPRCIRIGEVTTGTSLTLLDEAGERDLPPLGWDHLRA